MREDAGDLTGRVCETAEEYDRRTLYPLEVHSRTRICSERAFVTAFVAASLSG